MSGCQILPTSRLHSRCTGSGLAGRYLYLALRINCVLLLLVVLASYALWRAGRKKPVVFVWTVACIWTFYLVIIGGDIFPAVRHFQPLVSLFGFLLPGCGLLILGTDRRIKRGIAFGLLAATVLVSTSDAMTDQEHWELQGESLGLFLHRAFGDKQPSALVGRRRSSFPFSRICRCSIHLD